MTFPGQSGQKGRRPMASVDRVAADCTGMQGKQASLLAEHSEDGPQQVSAHIERAVPRYPGSTTIFCPLVTR